MITGSGLKSNDTYLFGSITMQIKLIPGNSAGTVTTFYLSSDGTKHDEIDFEFLGNSSGMPYTIHTNVFTQGVGQREQQFKATWYDPTDGFHNYTILWSPFAIVWLVDSIPIRVFRKYNDTEINYPDAQPMNAYASLWNADDWATQGGLVKTNWTLAPFSACFQNYDANACVCPDQSTVAKCSETNPANWWTDASKYGQLSDTDYYQMEWIRQNYMIYDYCIGAVEHDLPAPKECSLPQY
ncbi:hypothetical protein RND81_07G096200 [Saponaria officinalis]|uniref:Xyloglucan endotransglucosylase/hydrolase n=1 Tax=Saponaria officinalis TaxID=3572 RepID=A0AAW1JQV5_SAPOF